MVMDRKGVLPCSGRHGQGSDRGGWSWRRRHESRCRAGVAHGGDRQQLEFPVLVDEWELGKEGEVGLVGGGPAHDPDRLGLAGSRSVRLEQARDLRHHPASRVLQVGLVGHQVLEITDAEDKARGGRRRCRLIIGRGGADGDDAVRGRLGEICGCGGGPDADEHGVASAGEDVGDAAAVVLPRCGPREGGRGRGDVGVVRGGKAAEEERRRARARGEAAEQRDGRRGAEDGDLDLVAAESRVGEDAADERVVEDGEDKVGEVDLDGVGGGGRRLMVIEVERVRVPALVGLRALDGGHEGVGDGGLVLLGVIAGAGGGGGGD
jgi:hypothetical protein|uniref:Uncharacterized protein n=1 Tax=Zea mays TaxID=4577 RepID=A0A804RBS3_MAIZE